MKPSVRWPLVVVALHLFYAVGDCIRWHMHPNSQKCFREELQKDELVKGEYAVTKVENQRIDYVIKDTKNHILSQKEDITSGKFTFSAEHFEIFEICFISKKTENIEPVVQEVFLQFITGVDMVIYEEMVDMKPLEIQLKRIEDFSKEIVLEFVDMKRRADEMRDTNESTGNRIFYFSMFSMGCLIVFATWQIMYLRRYFKAKKLIE